MCVCLFYNHRAPTEAGPPFRRMKTCLLREEATRPLGASVCPPKHAMCLA